MTVPTGCAEAVERLWDYVDGALDEVDTAEVERHLEWCLRCCGEVVFARQLRVRLAGSDDPLPRPVEDRFEALLDELAPPVTAPESNRPASAQEDRSPSTDQ